MLLHAIYLDAAGEDTRPEMMLRGPHAEHSRAALPCAPRLRCCVLLSVKTSSNLN